MSPPCWPTWLKPDRNNIQYEFFWPNIHVDENSQSEKERQCVESWSAKCWYDCLDNYDGSGTPTMTDGTGTSGRRSRKNTLDETVNIIRRSTSLLLPRNRCYFRAYPSLTIQVCCHVSWPFFWTSADLMSADINHERRSPHIGIFEVWLIEIIMVILVIW